MEAGQLTETKAAVAEKSEMNRSLKRNIGELVMEIKTNGRRVCVIVNSCVFVLSSLIFTFNQTFLQRNQNHRLAKKSKLPMKFICVVKSNNGNNWSTMMVFDSR